ncbi:GAF domain-containing protein [Nocardia sp. NPDC005978]|uniref:GAF domain-containing protein n=1 Tax=Nocardia sp. NPDC005978 TaxID=3156725 RepID=UPI0033A1283E
MVIPWLTLETLAADIVSVASLGDAPRNFASWYRVVQRLLSKIPACYDTLTTRDIADKVRATRQRGEGVDLTIPTNSGRYRLLTRPIFGPTGEVHAVRVWLGPANVTVPTPQPAVGVIWDLDTQTILQPDTVTQLTGVGGEAYVPTLSIAELFHRATVFDQHAELLELLYDPDSGGRLQFDATIRDRRGRNGVWRITIRTRVDHRGRGAWWLIEDVTSTASAPERAPLESVGLREAHRRAGTHLALVQVEWTSIAHWLTDPAPWVRWDYLYRPVDVFHPDDRAQLMELGDQLRSNDTAGMTIRTLNYFGEYTATRLLLYPHPGFPQRKSALAQLTWAACDSGATTRISRRNNNPFAPEQPFGYDAELREITTRDHAS